MLGWHLSATVLVMVVLGGLRSVTGPLVGAAVLMGLEEVLKATTAYWKVAEGLVIIALVLLLPGGVRQLASLVVGTGDDRTRAPCRSGACGRGRACLKSRSPPAGSISASAA
jgi:branched-chain amino acid transport system permease protein